MGFALLKHDAAIGAAVLRKLTGRIGDLLTVLVALPLLAMFARAALHEMPEDRRQLLAFGVSLWAVAVLAEALTKRVEFHRTDGIMARFAQGSDAWLGYVLPLLSAGVILGLLAMAALTIFDARGATLGALSGLALGLLLPVLRAGLRRWWRDLARRTRPALLRERRALVFGAAAAATIGLICAWLTEGGYRDFILAGGYGSTVLLLTGRVDAGEVRYMTLVGHASVSLLRNWLPVQLALLLPFTAALSVARSWSSAGVAALFALGLPAFTTLRIYAYRAFSRVLADWTVAIAIFATGYAAITVAPLGPVVAIAAILWFARRGSGARWLLP